MRALFVLVIAAAALGGVTCTRETGEPDPPTQVLVPCDPSVPEGDPLACPRGDAGGDAAVDAQPDAAIDAPIDAAVDAPID